MHTKHLLILIVLNLAAFGLILTLRDRQQNHSHAHPIGLNLPAGTFESLESLTISTPLLPKDRIFVKKKQQWMIQSPVEWAANPFAIQRLLNQLEFLEHEISFKLEDMETSGQTLSDYGLHDPLLTIALKTVDQEFVIKIGRAHADENRLYILNPNQEEIIATSAHFLDPFLLDLAHLKSSSLFEIPPFEVQSLVIQMHQPKTIKMRLVQRDAQWMFEAPFSGLAQKPAVEATIAMLASLPIIQFIDSPSIELTGLQTPSITITQIGLERRETLWIGNRLNSIDAPPQVYAQLEGNPTIFTLPAEPLEALQKLQNDLRERHIVSTSLKDLQSLEISDHGSSIHLQRLENGTWNMRFPDGTSKPADEPTIQDLIISLEHLEAVAFVSDTPSERDMERWGLTPPQKSIVIESSTSETLNFGKINTDGLLYAQKEGCPTVYTIRTDELDPFATHPLFYKPRWLELIPKDYTLEGLQFLDLESQKIMLEYATHILIPPTEDAKLNEATETQSFSFEQYLAQISPRQAQALQKLLASCQHLRIQTFLEEKFNPQVAVTEPEPIQWKYRLQLSFNNPQQTGQTVYLFFTDRIGAQLQIGGDPQSATTFTLLPHWMDLLADLTQS